MSGEPGIWLRLVLAALATWRIAHLLTAEDGPGGIFARLRARLGGSFAGRMMDCFGCMSLWIAIPFAFYVASEPVHLVMTWLALSGVGFLLERLGPLPLTVRALPESKEGEKDNELLRPSALRHDPAANNSDLR